MMGQKWRPLPGLQATPSTAPSTNGNVVVNGSGTDEQAATPQGPTSPTQETPAASEGEDSDTGSMPELIYRGSNLSEEQARTPAMADRLW